ncbi:hypothetical protein EB796_023594 [Bugula neritina]|uniref:Uncharacterized protein n=1 Tax=Bugula neritina TaxID=10212 RepID=A0A7J7IY14_BUGNE|nr:hypothetical protein EB796_023594 [Bugula neritina]
MMILITKLNSKITNINTDNHNINDDHQYHIHYQSDYEYMACSHVSTLTASLSMNCHLAARQASNPNTSITRLRADSKEFNSIAHII